jgi:hypothetical protein
MGKDGIIAEHPTLKLKYLDPEMARLSEELKEKLDEERHREEENNKEGEETHLEGTFHDESTRIHLEPRRKSEIAVEGRL